MKTRLMRSVVALLASGALLGNAPRNTDWELLGNSPEMQHHSDLAQINKTTVKHLELAWAVPLPVVVAVALPAVAPPAPPEALLSAEPPAPPVPIAVTLTEPAPFWLSDAEALPPTPVVPLSVPPPAPPIAVALATIAALCVVCVVSSATMPEVAPPPAPAAEP